MKAHLQFQLGGSSLEGWVGVLQKVVYALNQHPLYGIFSPIARIIGNRNQGVGMGIIPLAIIPSDPPGTVLLPVLITLSFPGLEILVPDTGALLSENKINFPLNQKLSLPSGHFELLMPLSQQDKKEITVFG